MRFRLIAISVLLASCSNMSADKIPTLLEPYKMDIRQGNAVTPEMRARLQFGMTRNQVHVLLGTPLIQDYLREGELHKLKDVMKESTNLGMKTFDQALVDLYHAGEISYEDALRHADSANEVRLKIKLAQGGDANSLSQGMDGVELVESQEDRVHRF